MDHSSNSSENGKTDVIQIDYLKLSVVEKDELIRQMQSATSALNQQKVKESKNACEFVQKLLDNDAICDLLIYLSRQPVFNKEFAEALKHNLDLLAATKKLKYFTNLTLGHNAILLK
jgi:NAD dependent epimerase/dehydratase family enzyme